jgi:hypothetical protein
MYTDTIISLWYLILDIERKKINIKKVGVFKTIKIFNVIIIKTNQNKGLTDIKRLFSNMENIYGKTF